MSGKMAGCGSILPFALLFAFVSRFELASTDTTTVRRIDTEHTMLQCARSCAKSPSCGLVAMSDKCHKLDNVDYADVTSDFEAYRRFPPETSPGQNRKLSIFKLVDRTGTMRKTKLASCDVPVSVRNADVQYDARIPGSKATYTCRKNFGFCRSNPVKKEITCLENGTWEKISKYCLQHTWLSEPTGTERMCPMKLGSTITVLVIAQRVANLGVQLLTWRSKVVLYLNALFSETAKLQLQYKVQKEKGKWGKVQKSTYLPFEEGKELTINISLHASGFQITTDVGHHFLFNYRVQSEKIQRFQVKGIEIKSIKSQWPVGLTNLVKGH